ncbi:helix-turn-helix transcriptional regulator [Haloarcula salinisoli]|uniref:Uncharacterized protein n=1 Tax=Haloarcula salinisoli TaxID=2487746 RepID=A0A8J8CBT1_9EURY|nr:hypothetical protein [Halomicroarcula salinisoli]MBX0285803.1 hypothetical protein [Halomicroarcula salinisoli]MBX0302710.1 hypothetical protein [Halomicroarcula salinisoli]
MPPAKNHAGVVAKRQDVLAVLETGMRKPELVDQLSLSRSTVDRAIDELQQASLVERDGSHYVTTYAGRESLAAYEGYLDRLDALAEAQPVLSALPPDLDIDPAVLEGAQVVESTPEAPEAPMEANMEYVTGATRFQGTGPTVLPRHFELMRDLVEQGTETELVLTESVLGALTDTYADDFEALSVTEELSLYVTDEAMSFAVWTAESPDRTGSGIVVYDDTGVAGVINNDTQAMNEWAQSVYERYKADAEQVF